MIRLRILLIPILLFTTGCTAGANLPTPAATAVDPPTAAPFIATPTLAIAAVATAEPSPSVVTATAAPAPATLSLDHVPPTPLVTPSATAADNSLPCSEPGRIEHGSLESQAAGETMRYRVYLPPCYGIDDRVFPTLYMFGGNIHDDAIWDMLGLDDAAEVAVISGEIPPLLIVMPDNGWLANTTTSGPNSYEGFILNELIPTIEAAYCAWPEADGRAVGGLSRGGYWSLMMAFRRPDLFRSVGAHSPALIDSYAGPQEDPVMTGAANNLGDLRIWVDIGERDPYFVEARPLHDALNAVGVAHEWRINEGTHDEAYWRANLMDYLAWYSDGWRQDRDSLPVCRHP